jgi:hypothetical protein
MLSPIYNQQLFFTFANLTPLTPMMMETLVTYFQVRIKLLNPLMESMWKNIGISASWNARIDDTMVVNSIVMITCMSRFSKPL